LEPRLKARFWWLHGKTPRKPLASGGPYHHFRVDRGLQMVINPMLNQTFIERLVARDYYVSDAPDFLPFVEPRSLTEPDKRLSHTSGSSVRPSVSLRPTTRVQVFADSGCRPLYRSQRLIKARPGVCLALALAVEPFEQDAPGAVCIVAAPPHVVRYGVVTQVPHHSYLGLPEHLSLPQHMADFLRPVRKFAQTLPQLLTAGSALHLEVSLFRLPAVMRESQKGKLLRLLTPLVCIFPGKSSKFHALGLLFRQSESKPFEPVP